MSDEAKKESFDAAAARAKAGEMAGAASAAASKYAGQAGSAAKKYGGQAFEAGKKYASMWSFEKFVLWAKNLGSMVLMALIFCGLALVAVISRRKSREWESAIHARLLEQAELERYAMETASENEEEAADNDPPKVSGTVINL